MFGWHLAFIACSLLEEGVDEIVNGFGFDHGLDGYWVVLENGDECLLDEALIDFVRVLQKQLNPSREVNLVIYEVFDYFLH